MATIASLDVRIGARTEALASGLRQAEGLVSGAMRRITGIMTSMPAMLGAGTIGVGLVAVGKKAITLAADLEQAKIGFTTMLGSAQKADAFLRDMAEFAAKTPFQFADVRNAAQRFLAFGFEAQKVIPILTAVGNAAAALGGSSELINRIALALGQMRAKGKVSGEEMRQLAEAGIPAWEMLAQTIGVSIPEAMQMAQKGMIDVDMALDGFITEMTTRFPQMMAKQSDTLIGMWSTIKDEVSLSLTVLGEKIIRTFNLKTTLANIRVWLADFRAILEKQGVEAALAKALGADTAKSLMHLFATLKTTTLPMIAELGKKLIDIAIVAAPYVLDALNSFLNVLPKIVQFFVRLPAYAKVGFTFLVQEFAKLAITANRTIAMIASALDQLPFIDLEHNLKGLESQYLAMMVAAAQATGEHKAALQELATLIDKQRQSATRMQETVAPAAEEAVETASQSIIRITTVLGDEISGTLKGGFGRGGAQGAEEVRQQIRSLQEYAAQNPITLRVRYAEEGRPSMMPVTMPAG